MAAADSLYHHLTSPSPSPSLSSSVSTASALRSAAMAATRPNSLLHTFACCAALLLGFSVSRQALYLSFFTSLPSATYAFNGSFFLICNLIHHHHHHHHHHPPDRLLHISRGSIHGAARVSLAPPSSSPPPPPHNSTNNKHTPIHHHGPHPLQTSAAHHLLSLANQEQFLHRQKTEKRLIVITPIVVSYDKHRNNVSSDCGADLMVRLACLLRTFRSPVLTGNLPLFIAIQLKGSTPSLSSSSFSTRYPHGKCIHDVSTLLHHSNLPFHHLIIPAIAPRAHNDDGDDDSGAADMEDLVMSLRAEGMRFIREQKMDGIVVFADPAGSTYTQDFFDQAQRVEWIGAFRTRPLPYSDMVRSINMVRPRKSRRLASARLIPTEDDGLGSVFVGDGDDVKVAINATSRSSSNVWWPQGSSALPADVGLGEEDEEKEEEEEVIGWYYAGGHHGRHHHEIGSEWSAIALNARLLWGDEQEDGTQNHHRHGPPVKPWWIKGWHDISNGGREVRAPLDLLRNSSFLESLGIISAEGSNPPSL